MSSLIRAEDSTQEKITKLLPADITAAFLSAKAALIAGAGDSAATYIFWTFIAILVISPFYFWFVTKAKNPLQIGFLALTFIVFAISIADTQFTEYFKELLKPWNVELTIRTIAIVLPIVWTFVIAPIFVAALGKFVVTSP